MMLILYLSNCSYYKNSLFIIQDLIDALFILNILGLVGSKYDVHNTTMFIL